MTTFSVAGSKLRALASLSPVAFGELVKSVKIVILEEADSGGRSPDIWERGYERLVSSDVPSTFWGPGTGRAWDIRYDRARILGYLSQIVAHIAATSPGFLAVPGPSASRERSVNLPVNNMQLPVDNTGVMYQRAATVGPAASDVLYEEFLVADALGGSSVSSQTAGEAKAKSSAEAPACAAPPENGTKASQGASVTRDRGYPKKYSANLTVVRKKPSGEPGSTTNLTPARKETDGDPNREAGPSEGPKGAGTISSAPLALHRRDAPPDKCKFCDKCAPMILDFGPDQLLEGHLAHVPQTDSIRDLLSNNPRSYKLFHVRVFPSQEFRLIFTRGTPALRIFLKAVRHIFDINQVVGLNSVTLYLTGRDEAGDKLVWPNYNVETSRDWAHLMEHATQKSCTIGVSIELDV